MISELMTIPQFCKAVNLGRTKVYSLLNSGDIKALKIGRKTLITKKSLEDYISSLPDYLGK